MRRIAISVVALAALAGCASINSLDSEVSSYGRWPAERKPATYVFERLPSQQAHPEQAQLLEDSARHALESAGFMPAAEGQAPDVSIQLGARITETDRSPFDDPLWYGPWGSFHRPFVYGRFGQPFWGPSWRYGGWGPGYDLPWYEREVAVLIRDKRSGEPLYETRANSDGASSAVPALLPAMFSAAMRDFPAGGSNPRRVSIPLSN
jgi:hypothetical protein